MYAEKVVKEFIVEYPEDHPIWDGRSIEDRVNEVIRRHIEKWTGILKEYNYDESRARRELKAEQVNYFVNNIGVIDQDNWKKVTFVHRNNNNENNEIIREVLILKN